MPFVLSYVFLSIEVDFDLVFTDYIGLYALSRNNLFAHYKVKCVKALLMHCDVRSQTISLLFIAKIFSFMSRVSVLTSTRLCIVLAEASIYAYSCTIH